MENTLFQRDRHFNRKWFTLTEQELQVKQKSLFRSDEYSVNYEDIGSKIIKSRAGKKAWLVASVVMFSLSLIIFILRVSDEEVGKGAELFYLLIGLICCFIYFISYKHSFYLTQPSNTNAIEFLADNPTKEQLDLFIKQLKSKQKEVLLEKYGQLNKNLNYETQYHNLTWLRDNNILTTEEHQEKLQQLDNLYSPSNRIGFGLSEN
jgi:hypothetical protein